MKLSNEMKPVSIDEIKEIAKNSKNAFRIFLHWTAGRYHQIYDEDYHISIDCDGRIYTSDSTFEKRKNHTYMRNFGSIGIAVCGCYDAEANNGYDLDMGSEPITSEQIEIMSIVVAVVCKYAEIPIENVLTHCEIAKIDGYGPFSGDPETRWDLWYLPDSDGEMKNGGDVIRGKAVWYLNNYNL